MLPRSPVTQELLDFVLAESALELVPDEIRSRPAIVSDGRRRGLEGGEILLDRSFHHSAMSDLRDSEKRGRPDLVHSTLLSVTGTPLYLDGKVRVLVHCYPDIVVEIAEKTRIPKNYLRFRGLMEKCLRERPSGGLIRVFQEDFPRLTRRLRPRRIFGMSVRGKAVPVSEFARKVVAVGSPCVVVGGFPHGHFSESVNRALDELVRIDSRPLEAHVVAARVVYEIERASAV